MFPGIHPHVRRLCKLCSQTCTAPVKFPGGPSALIELGADRDPHSRDGRRRDTLAALAGAATWNRAG